MSSSLMRWRGSLVTVVLFLACLSCRWAMLLQLGRKMMPFMASICIAQQQYTDIARLYDNAAQRYDSLDGSEIARKLGLDGMRDDLGVKVTGKVLEVGAGTGLQLSHYRWSQMRSMTAVDISNGMLNVLKEKVAKLPPDVKEKIDVQVDNVEQLTSAKDNEYDTVVDTFSMCVYPHPDLALQEMKRVVRPDGRILLLENTVSTNPILAKVQQLTSPLLAPFSRECKWDVDVPKLAKEAGLQLEEYADIQQGTIMLGVYHK